MQNAGYVICPRAFMSETICKVNNKMNEWHKVFEFTYSYIFLAHVKFVSHLLNTNDNIKYTN